MPNYKVAYSSKVYANSLNMVNWYLIIIKLVIKYDLRYGIQNAIRMVDANHIIAKLCSQYLKFNLRFDFNE